MLLKERACTESTLAVAALLSVSLNMLPDDFCELYVCIVLEVFLFHYHSFKLHVIIHPNHKIQRVG